jgi:hypothetical protein
VLEFQGFAEFLEQALGGAEGHRAMMIVTSSTSPAARPADEVCAAHHMQLLLAGCSLGPIDRLNEAPDEDEAATWLWRRKAGRPGTRPGGRPGMCWEIKHKSGPAGPDTE